MRSKITAFQNVFLEEWRAWKKVFFVCLAINLLAYGFYITHVTYSVDDYGTIFSTANTMVSGRWVIEFIHNIACQTSLAPTLIGICCVALFTLTGIGVCRLWGIRGNACIMVIALWSTHPYLLDVYSFRFNVLSSGIGYFLSVAALWASTKKMNGLFLSVILYYVVLSIYQTILGFTIAVIMLQFLFICLKNSFSREAIKSCLKLSVKYALMLLGAIIMYLVLTKVIFVVFDVPVNPRMKAGFINSFGRLLAKMGWISTILVVRLLPIKEYVLPIISKWLIVMIFITAAISLVVKINKKSFILPALLWVCLIPFGAVSFMIPLENSGLPWRTCMGLVVFIAGMFALTQESHSVIIRRTGFIAGYILIVNFIFINNTMTYKQYLQYQKDTFMGNRIIAKIQSLDQYHPGMKLAIVGTTDKSPKRSKTEKYTWNSLKQSIQYESHKRSSITRGAFETSWSKYAFLLNYMDLELQRAERERVQKARTISMTRKPWPDPSSVFIDDDMVVLILSLPNE